MPDPPQPWPRHRRKRSVAWRFFDESPTDPNVAICRLCFRAIPRGRRLARNTTNLLKHLMNKHPHEYALRNEQAPPAPAPDVLSVAGGQGAAESALEAVIHNTLTSCEAVAVVATETRDGNLIVSAHGFVPGFQVMQVCLGVVRGGRPAVRAVIARWRIAPTAVVMGSEGEDTFPPAPGAIVPIDLDFIPSGADVVDAVVGRLLASPALVGGLVVIQGAVAEYAASGRDGELVELARTAISSPPACAEFILMHYGVVVSSGAGAGLESVDMRAIAVLVTALRAFRDVRRVLDPASGACRRPSAASVAVTIPSLKGIRAALDAQSTSAPPGLASALAEARASLDAAFGDIESRPLYALATLLDPRFKARVFHAPAAALHAQARLVALSSEHSATGLAAGPSGGAGEDGAGAVRAYLAEPLEDFCADVEDYWRSRSRRWPQLATVASHFLAPPASATTVAFRRDLPPLPPPPLGGEVVESFVRQNAAWGVVGGGGVA